MKKTLPILMALLFVASCMCAKTITVTSSADSGAGSLREAVTNAVANDSIVFADNVTSITLSATINLYKNIAIIGNKTNSTTIIASNVRHFFTWDMTGIGKPIVASFSNLILKDGHAYTCGGAIFNEVGNTLTINNCSFINNNADQNCGAVFNTGKLILFNCFFNGNFSNSYGSGAFLNGGTAYIYNTIFINNSAKIVNSSSAYSPSAGAVYNYNGSFLILKNCLFKANQGDVSGGLLNRGNVTVINCLFSENKSTSFKHQGVLFNFKLGSYDSKETSLTIINSTITNNIGEGIYNSQTLKLYNSIVTNNNADQDIYNDSIGSVTTANNLIGSSNTSLSGNGNILNTDPLFIGNGDYSLQATSPAINTGSNDYMSDSITTDIIGNKRINNSTIDLGAYEYQSPASILLNSEPSSKIYSSGHSIFVESANVQISIYNTMGQLVAQGTKTEYTMPIAGVYFCRFGDKMQKIIVK